MEKDALIKILYQDDDIIVCIKPAGVISEDGGMPEKLRAQLALKEIYCVHRLDKNVSGIMVYAAAKASAAALSASFANGKAIKKYLAVVEGMPESESGTLKDLLFHDRARNKTFVVKSMRKGVKEALLDYSVRAAGEYNGKRVSLVDIRLHSGRSHQIRVQFASRKMPLAGDAAYGSSIKTKNIALISYALEFEHPQKEERMAFSISPPDEAPWNIFKEY